MSLIATLAQEFRAQSPTFGSNEFRPMRAGCLDVFQKQTNGIGSFITDDLRQKAALSMGRDVKIPYINYKDVTIRSNRPLVIADDENTSGFYTVTWTTFAYGFTMYPRQHFTNDVDYQQDFNGKMNAMLVKMTSAIEGSARTAIDAAKTQVIAEVTGGHTFAANVVSETAANLKESYIQADLEPMMNSNDFDGMQMDILGNQGFLAVLRRMEGFSDFNTENKTLQFMGKDYHFSNAIANAADKAATGYAIAPGTLGMLTRVEPDSLFRTTLPDGHEWGTIVMPGLGIEFGTYGYTKAVDVSGNANVSSNLTRTVQQAFDFAVDIAWVTKWNSDRATIPSPVIGFDLATA